MFAYTMTVLDLSGGQKGKAFALSTRGREDTHSVRRKGTLFIWSTEGQKDSVVAGRFFVPSPPEMETGRMIGRMLHTHYKGAEQGWNQAHISEEFFLC